MSIRYGPPKLPARQLAILAIARISEPIALTSILPYLPEMIEHFGVDRRDVGRWTGLCMGLFSLSQSACGIPWGAMSDRFGRKPIVICSLTMTMITLTMWGLATSLPMAMTVRVLSGMSNANVGIIRTMVAELVPWKELQPRAFSIMPIVWSLGSAIGPTIGGVFANPARQWPSVFGNIQFFKDFPYALPSFIAASLFLGSLISAIFFLEETIEWKRGQPDWGLTMGKRILRAFSCKAPQPSSGSNGGSSGSGSGSIAPVIDDNDREAAEPLVAKLAPSKPKPTRKYSLREMYNRETSCFLAAYFVVAFFSVSFDQLMSVFLSDPYIEHTAENTKLPFYFSGGFGYSTSQVGTMFTLFSCINLLQIVFFPFICRVLGPLKCLRLFSLLHPIYVCLVPYVVLIQNPTVRYYAILILMCTKGLAIVVSFPSLTVVLTNSVCSTTVLGMVNGSVVAIGGLARAIGPAVCGSAFSWGRHRGYGVTAWFLLSAVTLVGAIPIFVAEGRSVFPGIEPDQPGGDSGGGNGNRNGSSNDNVEAECASIGMPSTTVIGSEDDEERSQLLGGPDQKSYGSSPAPS